MDEPENKLIILAFDIGTHHTGVAIFRAGESYPVGSIHHSRNRFDILKAVGNEIKRYSPDIVVIGIPRYGNIKKLVNWLSKQITQEYDIPVELVSEDNTTRYVKDQLILENMGAIIQGRFTSKAIRKRHTKAKQRGIMDAQAAVIILQRFIDSINE